MSNKKAVNTDFQVFVLNQHVIDKDIENTEAKIDKRERGGLSYQHF